MYQTFICLGCGKEKAPAPTAHKTQSYCGDRKCQKKRKADWQCRRLNVDADYRANQKHADDEWRKSRPDYWREYRDKNANTTERNRQLQKVRNQRKRRAKPPDFTSQETPPMIAKMDALAERKSLRISMVSEFWLIPVIAKMDALKVKIVEISES